MSSFPVREVGVEVPASTANLGSGFDALGMALSLHDKVHARVTDGPVGSATVSVTGQGAGSLPADERHLVVRVVHDTLSELGFPEPPALDLRCENNIPHSRGLGSSAAAIVAGVALAHGLAGIDLRATENAERALHLAAVREGHADNVAASLLGDFVLAWRESGRFRAVSVPVHPDVAPVAFVPQAESATHLTRGLLPEQVPHADAAFAAGRSALAVHALTRDPSLLLAATDDRLHQDYREPAWPETVALVRGLRSEGIAAAVSGAGPTVLALPVKNVDVRDLVPSGFAVLDLPVDREGVRTRVEA
ncbi:homoserine kinase [Saccharopolyspora dendranthemae]|uniref:Homoserine kinase n=1 Tax=Saccharopolyspora dendranthemae TaxID=1181886 RepID=A0A561VC54_9PSEU|nr:homoserine kinase [Saccharopolyspora dendranthemae]TWG09137.1 homoserine kinase [Saccharopolyspora dendranthemae]